ncbi:hypothetical protein PybrP1_000805 [[Pythium] brassicae (nom. inval.)]|nr:hypothetical protein PybrP1_000805 [[Pythium] brassicae (nom. inval.)]
MHLIQNGNLQQIEECVRDGDSETLETRDRRGNRALHLALKFAHRDSVAIVKRLVAIHQAIAAENEELLRLLVQKEKQQAPALLRKKIATICPQLAQLPDFYCEMHVDVSTWIPGVSRWLPSDTVKIWKRGADIRFDISLVGFENGSWKRGDLSFLLLGRDASFLCLDHKAHVCTDMLAHGSPLSDSDLDATVHFLLTTTIVTSDFDVSRVAFQPKHRSWLSKTQLVQDIGSWKDTRVYDVRGVEARLRIRRPQNRSHKPPVTTAAAATPPAADAGAAADEVQRKKSATPSIDAFSTLADALSDTPSNTEVVVDASAEHVVSAELCEGEVVTWKFSTDKFDIAFGVKFLRETGDSNSSSNGNNGGDWEDVVALQRCASHENEQSGSFQAPSAGTAVFTWSNTYSHLRSKSLHFVIQTQASTTAGAKNLCSSSQDPVQQQHHGTREEATTFENWFGVRVAELPGHLQALKPRRQIMVHSQPRSREMSKTFPATVYMSDQFPMSLREFLPVVELLSKTTSAFENVKAVFEAHSLEGFPVQFVVPLVPAVAATFRFGAVALSSPSAARFDVPLAYTRPDDSVNPSQEVFQHVAAV